MSVVRHERDSAELLQTTRNFTGDFAQAEPMKHTKTRRQKAIMSASLAGITQILRGSVKL
ncbi:MAG: hypothetical protein IJR63_11595 [Synergistaceae bacterium]|nr:hypothetical protein [Synergistaceae bacterium]